MARIFPRAARALRLFFAFFATFAGTALAAPPTKLGDLNADGTLDVFDLTILRQHIRQITPLPEILRPFADVNGDGFLNEEVASFLEDAQANDFQGVTHDFLETTTRAHGRVETRRYWISEEIQRLTQHAQWKDLRAVGMVESIREMQGKRTRERRFFIASIGANADPFDRLRAFGTFARAVRGHWGIENTLHWSLDVSFAEDPFGPFGCAQGTRRLRAGSAACAAVTRLKISPSLDIRASISTKAKPPKSAASKANKRTPDGMSPIS